MLSANLTEKKNFDLLGRLNQSNTHQLCLLFHVGYWWLFRRISCWLKIIWQNSNRWGFSLQGAKGIRGRRSNGVDLLLELRNDVHDTNIVLVPSKQAFLKDMEKKSGLDSGKRRYGTAEYSQRLHVFRRRQIVPGGVSAELLYRIS